MQVREKGKKDAEPVFMDFGQGMAAIQSGAYEEVPIEGERGPDIVSGSVDFQPGTLGSDGPAPSEKASRSK